MVNPSENVPISPMMKDESNVEDVTRKRSRHDRRKAKELEKLEEAREADTASASDNEKGYHPHSPKSISTCPSYMGEASPTMKRQRVRSNSTDYDAEIYQLAGYDFSQDGAIVPHVGAEEEVDYEGENIVHCSGETRERAIAQLLPVEAREIFYNVDSFANRTKLESLRRAYDYIQDEDQGSIVDRDGDDEQHLQTPNRTPLLAQPEQYDDDSECGEIIEGRKQQAMASQDEKDTMPTNRTQRRKTRRERNTERNQRIDRQRDYLKEGERQLIQHKRRIQRRMRRRLRWEIMNRPLGPTMTKTTRVSHFQSSFKLETTIIVNTFGRPSDYLPRSILRDIFLGV